MNGLNLFSLASYHGISGKMPFKVSSSARRTVLRPPRRPLIPDNGHLVGHNHLNIYILGL